MGGRAREALAPRAVFTTYFQMPQNRFTRAAPRAPLYFDPNAVPAKRAADGWDGHAAAPPISQLKGYSRRKSAGLQQQRPGDEGCCMKSCVHC